MIKIDSALEVRSKYEVLYKFCKLLDLLLSITFSSSLSIGGAWFCASDVSSLFLA